MRIEQKKLKYKKYFGYRKFFDSIIKLTSLDQL
jgi:hypothetical protein